MLSAADRRIAPLLVESIEPGGVYAIALVRDEGTAVRRDRMIDLSRAHPDVLAALASAISSENTANTSALLGSLRTLLAIATAVRNRSYVIAAAVTSESGMLSASISSTRASNALFIVMGALEVAELSFDHIPEAA